jgi:hypothetical protein
MKQNEGKIIGVSLIYGLNRLKKRFVRCRCTSQKREKRMDFCAPVALFPHSAAQRYEIFTSEGKIGKTAQTKR